MAELLGVGKKTYTRWEAGRSIQNKSSDNLIRLADRHPEQFLELEAQRDPERGETIRGWFEEVQRRKSIDSYGMAAHGGKLDPGTCEMLRDQLRKIAQRRMKG